MEMELKDIIAKIKEEGVGEAEKKAEAIIQEAQTKAKDITEGAKKQQEEIIKKGEQEAAKLKENGEKAIKQASRDVVLSLREKIIELFDRIIKDEVKGSLSAEIVKDMIEKIADNFKKDGQLNIELLVGEKDRQSLEKSLLAALKKEMQKGITIKVSPNVEKGFMIGEKDGGAYYDFTDEAITEAFMTYLNPKIVDILTAEKK